MKTWIKSLAVALLFTAAPAHAFKVGGMTWVTSDGTANQVMKTDGAGNLGWKSVIGPTDLSATAPITYNSGTGVIAIPLATNSVAGYLSASDRNDFWNRITGLTGDVTATGPTGSTGPSNVAGTVVTVGGSTASNVHAAELLANAATSANTASTIVKRGSAGEFAAGAITASFIGAHNGTVGATTPAAGTFTTGIFGTSLASTGDFAVATNKFTVAAASGNTAVAGTFGVTGAGTFSSTLGVTGDFAVATNKFTVAAASGNTLIAGTGDVTGNFAVATNKFTVAAASGNTVVAGTLGVTGVATFTAQPIASTLTASQAVFTDGSKGLVSNAITGSGNVVMSASPTLTGTIGAASGTFSGTLGVTGVATFTAAPVFSSGTASQAMFLDGSKGLVTNAITGSGNVVMSASPTLTGTIGAANATFSGTTLHTGVATFTAQPIMSSLTASQAVFSDGSKGLVSNAITGSGNVVMSASPTLTGTIGAASLTLSGTLGVTSTSTFTGAATLNGTSNLVNPALAGANGIIFSTQAVSTGNTDGKQSSTSQWRAHVWDGAADSTKVFAASTYPVSGVNSAYLWTLESADVSNVITARGDTGSSTGGFVGIGTASPDARLHVNGTSHLVGAATLDSTLGVTGNFAVATNKFTVAAASGNTVVAGTLGVTGITTFSSQVGFGTSAATAVTGIFYNASNDARMELSQTSALSKIESTYGSTAGYKPLEFFTGGAATMYLTAVNNVGIGVSPASTDRLAVEQDQNGDTVQRIKNATSGTGATARLVVESASSSGYLAAFDTANTVITAFADRVVLDTNSDAAGLSLSTATAGQDMKFYTGARVLAATIDSSQNATFAGSMTVSGGALNVSAAATSQFGNTSNSAPILEYMSTGGFGLVSVVKTSATSNTTHQQAPYISARASIWNGSSAVAKDVAYTTYGVSGTNSAYYGAIESSDQSQLITFRGDVKAVGIGTTPNTSYALTVNGAINGNNNLVITGSNHSLYGQTAFGASASNTGQIVLLSSANDSYLSIKNQGTYQEVFSTYSSTAGAKPLKFGVGAGFTAQLTLDTNLNVAIGQASANATNATNGFMYIPTSAGTPTGVPATSYSGLVPFQYDTTNHKICVYDPTTPSWRCTAAI